MKNTEENEIFHEIERLSVPLLESIASEEIGAFKFYHKRYFEDFYCTSFNSANENNDILLRFHTNKLILISIAKGHDIFRNGLTIERINFTVKGVNMAKINLSGKKKNGAKKVNKNTILCFIKCTDSDKEYPINCCVSGTIIEVNNLLNKTPQVLTESYKELGYIAVINPARNGPNAVSMDKISNLQLKTEEEYKNYLLSN